MNITYLKVILSLITNPNPNNIYHLNDPNTKVPITPNKNKKRNNKEPIHHIYLINIIISYTSYNTLIPITIYPHYLISYNTYLRYIYKVSPGVSKI